LKLKEHGNSKDILGRTYEYAIAQFASLEGRQAGEFYTPSSIVQTLVEILQPYEGRVYEMIIPKLIQFNDCKRAVA